MLKIFDSLLRDYFNFWNDGYDFPSKIEKFDFNETNDCYKLAMDVDFNATEDNVEINLEKDGLVTINYHIKHETSEHMFSVKEYLPKDADSDTLDAEIRDGKLIVTVKRKNSSKKIAIKK